MALTAAQIFEHIGRMMARGIMNELQQGGDLDVKDLPRWAKNYRLLGNAGTIADRTEAMKAFQEQLFTQLTGLDPTVASHFYRKHYLAGLAPGEEAVL